MDRIEEPAADLARVHAAWGHRKIAAMMKADGVAVSASSVERALRRKGLLLPARYLADRRENAKRRKERFLAPPRRRNRVWQMDFSRFETAAREEAGTSLPVMDYATKLCVAAPITGNPGCPRCRLGFEGQRSLRAEELSGEPLLSDCVDRQTGEIAHLTIVTDNGPAYKSDAFLIFLHGPPRTGARKDPSLLPRSKRGRGKVLPVPQIRVPLSRGDR